MPLIFEITRETQQIESESHQANYLKSKGYTDRQLTELGFHPSSFQNPSALKAGVV